MPNNVNIIWQQVNQRRKKKKIKLQKKKKKTKRPKQDSRNRKMLLMSERDRGQVIQRSKRK
jgi:hypothetical protein